MTEILSPDLLWSGGRFVPDQSVLIDNGLIQQVGSPDVLLAQAPTAHRRRLPGQALVPGTSNAHNHSFQSLVRGFGDDLPFFQWRDNGIYRYSLNLDEEGVYTGAILAFGEMLRYGVTTVVDFFYLHHESHTYYFRGAGRRSQRRWSRHSAASRQKPGSRQCRRLLHPG